MYDEFKITDHMFVQKVCGCISIRKQPEKYSNKYVVWRNGHDHVSCILNYCSSVI